MGNALVHLEITPRILSGVSDATRFLGQYEGQRCALKPGVKREHFLMNLHGNLALEGNTLSTSQLKGVHRGEKVGAMESELVQARAFLAAYERSEHFSAVNKKDLLTAYLLMQEGRPLGPMDQNVSAEVWNARMKESLELVDVLFRYIEDEKLTHPIVKAAVFHFQLFHIRPFERTNDAVARLWHRLLLGRFHRLFFYAPFELLLKQNQQAYVDAMGQANTHDSQQRFIEFSLQQVVISLKMVLESLDNRHQRVDDRLAFAKMHFGGGRLTRKKYMSLFQNIGPATASRDLKTGLDAGMLTRMGHKARTEYCFV
ncbi:MAG: Fic family protein [Deltaproteobacteria bacterium]|nr:Fic family protein [Deltaproteobacteria bacterium]